MPFFSKMLKPKSEAPATNSPNFQGKVFLPAGHTMELNDAWWACDGEKGPIPYQYRVHDRLVEPFVVGRVPDCPNPKCERKTMYPRSEKHEFWKCSGCSYTTVMNPQFVKKYKFKTLDCEKCGEKSLSQFRMGITV